VRLLAAPDKMRGTLEAPAFAAAIARISRSLGHEALEFPLSDGGEGFAERFGGTERRVEVTGPLGARVTASFRLLDDGALGVVEMASAAGRARLVNPQGDDPVSASTIGVGELIVAAVGSGARTVIVGCGGSATTDGGRGAVAAIEAAGGLGGTEIIVATDVLTRFVDAAASFGPQKGASSAQVKLLERRLEADAAHYLATYGREVTGLDRSGAAGGLAGGLAALGGELTSGFDLLAERLGLDEMIRSVDLVVTGEGALDATTLEGKAISGLLERVPEDLGVVLICGRTDESTVEALAQRHSGEIRVFDLTARHGRDAALSQTEALVEMATAEALGSTAA
jgi:glycerate kinase